MIPICRDGKFGFINSKSEEVIEPSYKDLRDVVEGIFWTPDSQTLFDVNGKGISEIDGDSSGEYMFECDIETGNILMLKRVK